MRRPPRREDYTVGWVCALPVELAAAQEMLDTEHADLERDAGDNDENLYTLGTMGGHKVVIVCLPAGRIGNNPAAAVATQMRATFRGIRVGLMVGVGGGVPGVEADVRLGDVVVSQPQGVFGGVVQYDMGRATPGGFERTGSLVSPPQVLLAAVNKVRASELRGRSRLSEYIAGLGRIPRFQRSKAGPDVLFEAAYDHEGGQMCEQCSPDRQVARQPRESGEEVVVHYGTIASGNQVMRNGAERDRVSAELGRVLCFEMEAAGLINSFPCLVIRGICDYADSHKNKRWQAYAAGTAAAYAKEVISMIPAADVTSTHTVEETIRDGLVDATHSEWTESSGISAHASNDLADVDVEGAANPRGRIATEDIYPTKPCQATKRREDSGKRKREQDDCLQDRKKWCWQDISLQMLSEFISQQSIPPQVLLSSPVTIFDGFNKPVAFSLDWIDSLQKFQVLMAESAGKELEDRFKDEGCAKIREGEFLIQDQDQQNLDLRRPWKFIMKPGVQRYMSIMFRENAEMRTSCPHCGVENKPTEGHATTCQSCQVTYERIVELDEDNAMEDGAPNATSPGVRKYPAKHMVAEEELRYCFRRLALMTLADQSLPRPGTSTDIPPGLDREDDITNSAGCAYTQVHYKCSHVRYTVTRRCKQENHDKCVKEVVALEYRLDESCDDCRGASSGPPPS